MAAPERIQRRRVKGWRMPAGAIYVGRPTRWGNPYPVVRYGAAMAYTLFELLVQEMPGAERARWLAPLTGHDLACWCAPGEACHADILLRYANPKCKPK